MTNKYSIQVENKTGSFRHYALFTAPPEFTGRVTPKAWSCVFATADVAPDQTADFEIYRQYFAVVGTSKGTLGHGANIKVSASQPVDVGSIAKDDSIRPGTTLRMITQSGLPAFDPELFPNKGHPSAFQFLTDSSFRNDQSFVLGFGGSLSGTAYTGPEAVFIAQPNERYQIKPKAVFYLTSGEYKEGEIIERSKITEDVFEIDFSDTSGSSTRQLVHYSFTKFAMKGN